MGHEEGVRDRRCEVSLVELAPNLRRSYVNAREFSRLSYHVDRHLRLAKERKTLILLDRSFCSFFFLLFFR